MPKAVNDNKPQNGTLTGSGTCPICANRTERAYRPFCSKKCADIDLGRWLNGKYVIEADPGGEEADSLSPDLLQSLEDEK